MQEAQTPSSFHTLMWETHEAQHEMSSEQQILRKKKKRKKLKMLINKNSYMLQSTGRNHRNSLDSLTPAHS